MEDSITISTNGDVYFGQDENYVYTEDTVGVIFAFGYLELGADLMDRGNITGTSGTSPVSYKLDGAAPNRILKIEWKNAGFYEEFDLNNTMFDFINVQLWLYETTNAIEVRIGPGSVVFPGSYYNGQGAVIGLDRWDVNMNNFIGGHYLSGGTAAPVLVQNQTTITGTPASGTIYTFNPINTSVSENTHLRAINVYPNPAADFVHIENHMEKATLRIFDAAGRQIIEKTLGDPIDEVDLRDFKYGIYFFNIFNSEHSYMVKVIK